MVYGQGQPHSMLGGLYGQESIGKTLLLRWVSDCEEEGYVERLDWLTECPA